MLVPHLAVASIAGIVGGLGLLWRGLGAFRRADRIADTAGSRIASVAVGEVRLTGIVEPAELLLTSPLQSRPCVWYRARVTERSGDDERTVLAEERAVGFRLRDETGRIRVFPRGSHWAIDERYDDSTGIAGDEPPGLALRTGPAIAGAEPDRDEQVRQLLAVRDPRREPDAVLAGAPGSGGRRRYREARVEPGDVITLVGFVEPFDQLPDPSGADAMTGVAGGLVPGFGIGRPVREPELDPDAHALPLAPPEVAARIERTFEIAPEALIVATRDDVPLLISLGTPEVAAAAQQSRFLVGLLGAVLAIVSAVALAAMLGGAVVL
jgi:hypothetical protein